jgi:hypothetical protein
VSPCQTAHCTHLPFYKKLPLYAKDTKISGVRTQEDCPSSKHVLYSLCPWAHMSGPSTFVHAPFSYKRGGMRRYTHTQSWAQSFRSHLRFASSYKLTSNISHSGVGYYAPAARTTLNPCVFLSSSHLFQLSSRTPKPFLILGFRAGALRHPAGDLLSDRPDNSTISAPERLTPNLTPIHHFPSINFRVLPLNRSVHGNGASRGQPVVFPVI